MKKIIKINNLKEIYQDYEAFILDQWGVMHDGVNALPFAIKCVDKLFKNKKKLFIISNSSKRNFSTLLNLNKIGFEKNNFSGLMTSGEMIWQYLSSKKIDKVKKTSNACFHIYDETKEDGKSYLDGLEKFNFVKNIEDADFILGCTPFSKKKF